MLMSHKARKKVAVLLVNNETARNAMRDVLGGAGFEVRQDVGACQIAEVGFIGAYFALLGVVRQVRAIDPLLPLVIVRNGDHELGTELELHQDYYDVIKLDYSNEVDVRQKFSRWFSEGHGKVLVGSGRNK